MMSKAITDPPLKQLFEMQDPTMMGLGTDFMAKGGSVFDVLNMGLKGVAQTFGLQADAAQVLLDKAKSLAVHSAREYREQRLVRKGPPNPLHRTGIRALVDTPTFDDLFNPDWEAAAPAQSLDSSISPAAYFLRLVELARALEERAVKKKFTFEARRPDLTSLIIDPTSAFQ